ncbi:MAG: hypothetical protein JRG96_11985 [Deltaproteobacteria bacterium]|nr:hypothetical protein [Deltaproteobacteria bacterium]
MLPDPLHPAVVHFPIALALLMPLLALLAAFAIQRDWLPSRGWAGIVLLQLLLVAFAVAAGNTGEDQEERVEKVVDEHYIEHHEEAAEIFIWIAALNLLPMGAGLMAGRNGAIARWASVAVALPVLALAGRVGHSGGELVYVHGAANAYVSDVPAELPAEHRDH